MTNQLSSKKLKLTGEVFSYCENMLMENHFFPLSSDDIFNVIDFCEKFTNEYDESHDMEHHVNVLKNAFQILKKINVSNATEYHRIFKIIFYVCMLHDVIDDKYQKDLVIKKNELDLFLRQQINDEWTNIKWIIENISYSKEKKNGYPIHGDTLVQLTRDICSDADKLEALGQIGIIRCQQYTMASNPDLNQNGIIKLVIQHCYDKLLRLKDNYIRTEPGKLMAEANHNIILEYVKKNETFD